MYEQLKSKLDLKATLEFYGLRFNAKGWALCPFHGDSKPSLHLRSKSSSREETFQCYVCKSGGDIITFVAKLFNLRNFEASRKLSDDFNLGLFKPLDDASKKKYHEERQKRHKQNLRIQRHKEKYLKYWDMYCYYDKLSIDLRMDGPSLDFVACVELREYYWTLIECYKSLENY